MADLTRVYDLAIPPARPLPSALRFAVRRLWPLALGIIVLLDAIVWLIGKAAFGVCLSALCAF